MNREKNNQTFRNSAEPGKPGTPSGKGWLWRGMSRFPVRLLIFAILWWGLAGGSLKDWPAAIFFSGLAALLSIILVPSKQLRLKALLGFMPFFFRLSLMGGIDVTTRAMKPDMPLKTGTITYPVTLKHPAARVFFIWVVSLLPGTAAAQLMNQSLRLHVLDMNQSHHERLRELEQRLDAIFPEV